MAEEDAQAQWEQLKRVIAGEFEYNGQPNGPPVNMEPLPLAIWSKRPRAPREELLGPLIVKGQRCVIGAETGAGKSTMVWWIVKALESGGTFLGWRASRPCRVLVVDAEQGDHDIARLADETHLAESENVVLLHVPDGLSLNSAAEERQKLELVLREGHFDVVVLDPLYKLHTGDPNDEREAVALMKLFDRWRTEFGFALILPAHMRKPQGRAREKDFTMAEISGASAYLRGAEVVVGLKLLAEGRSQLHFFKSRSPGLPVRTSWMLRYDRHTGFSLYEDGASKQRREREEWMQKMRDLLEQAGGAGCDLEMLIDDTGRSRSKVLEALREIGAESIPMPGGGRKRLYLAPGARPSQAEMDILADDDEDDDE